MTKSTRKKPAKVAGEKVSAPRRHLAALKERSNVLADSTHVEALVRDLGEMIEAVRQQVAVVIELKIGDFKPADSGQVELYLRRQETRDGRVPRPRYARNPRCGVPDRASFARSAGRASSARDRSRA
jgi:hypothetical protein